MLFPLDKPRQCTLQYLACVTHLAIPRLLLVHADRGLDKATSVGTDVDLGTLQCGRGLACEEDLRAADEVLLRGCACPTLGGCRNERSTNDGACSLGHCKDLVQERSVESSLSERV